MASALWSSPSQSILDFPAKYLVAFMDNHHMLQISDRPLWRVLANGSKSYIEAVEKTMAGRCAAERGHRMRQTR